MGTVVSNIVSEWSQQIGLVLLTKKLIEPGSKESHDELTEPRTVGHLGTGHLGTAYSTRRQSSEASAEFNPRCAALHPCVVHWGTNSLPGGTLGL